MRWHTLPSSMGPYAAWHLSNLPRQHLQQPWAERIWQPILGSHPSVPKLGTRARSSQIWPLFLPAVPSRQLSRLLQPSPSARLVNCSFFLESIELASVVQAASRRLCCQSRAALINLVCEAVFSALVNVRHYLPESLLHTLNKSQGKSKPL